MSFLNFSKCKYISFGHFTQAILFYSDGDVHQISMVRSEKDLSVIFDENLHFRTHINEIIHKANNVLGIIKRTFNSGDPNTTLCHTYPTYSRLCFH